MRALSPSLRKQLETSVVAARRAAESASRAAIEGLGVFADRRPEYLDTTQTVLRKGLRAKWRQLGGDQNLLVTESAYEQWHRLLFARFLAENSLLLHPVYKAPVTLADCDELSAELGEPDAWSVAARFAAEILPGIFRLDDPCVRLPLAPEGRHALEQILDGIPAETFAADDALGWVYQSWQKDKKDEVNASERKIGGADLGPVTQLFTENYMVRFLLENSLGAWWAARHPDSPLVTGYDYLRVNDDGRPAARTFDGWPEHVAEITVMDPCCGSGHFLVEAFSMLSQMRAEEECLSPVDAQDAVLSDNLFGLELDPRCVQIAMFAIAIFAWKQGGGWRNLPTPNIACSGISVKAPFEEWTALADSDENLKASLKRMHALFRDADTLGSLIDPRRAAHVDAAGVQWSLGDVDFDEVASLLEKAAERETADPATAVFGAGAAGIVRAATLLSRTYILIVTNVPYLESRGQSSALAEYLKLHHPAARYDLATAIIERSLAMARTCAMVSPQNWLLLKSYEAFRRSLLTETDWHWVSWLGSGAFNAISGEVVNVALTIHSAKRFSSNTVHGLDASQGGPLEKQRQLRFGRLQTVEQRDLRRIPDARFSLDGPSEGPLLAAFAEGLAGIMTGDSPRFVKYFWEVPAKSASWEYLQSTVSKTTMFGGRESVIYWQSGPGGAFFEFHKSNRARLHDTHQRGSQAWGRRGIAVRSIGDLPATISLGDRFDNNVAVVLPKRDDYLPAIWAYLSSDEFNRQVRRLDRKMNVTNATLVKVPFDMERWRAVAAEQFPEGLPEPWSDDPTQWLFEGRPEVSTAPLQVAVARLVGFVWPEQAPSDDLSTFADVDGIVCLPPVAGEAPGADRVQQVLAAAFGAAWSPAKAKALLQREGSKKKDLADWLRNEFFKQHCALFRNRPFVWHIWDGQRDGFSALVNYHRLDRRTLEKLTYSYLGQDWVERQRAELREQVPGAHVRLAAALGLQKKLEAIIGGEAPFDIYVRWKALHAQPIGWEPDVNDGVRLNVRPFVEAGALRTSFNIHWHKDRGRSLDGSERENDKHLTLAEKVDARKRVGRA